MLLPLCLTACNNVDGEKEETNHEQSSNSTSKPTDVIDDPKQPNGDEGGDKNQGGNEGQGGNDNEGGNETPSEPSEPSEPEEPEEPLILEREVSYLPETVLNKVTGLFENTANGGTSYWMEGAPYTLRDRESFKDKTLSSISLAVYGTKMAVDGDFIFTLYIFKDTPEAIADSSPLRTYKIKVSAEEYGLTENASGVYKFITVDLTDYEIQIADDEIMSFADKRLVCLL